MFQDLKEIATDEEQPDQSIACINFIYPLTIYAFNEVNEYVSTTFIEDDPQFSKYLEALDLNYSISVSFPITSTLISGEEIIINTKEELKTAIDNCLSEEVVTECNTLLRSCVWKVGYSFNYDNTYLGGVFREDDGLTNFNIDSNLFNGSWSSFIIENELHININLINADETGTFFNYDWKVEYLDENSLLLTNGDRELVLNQRCDVDFETCGNFIFEVCENEINSETSNFILDDYTPCILDILELETTSVVSYFLTPEDAHNETNPILSNELYNNTENNQSVYVKIIDVNNMDTYLVEIILASISC